MKIRDGFVMREVMGQTVVVAVGETSKKFHGMIKMNKTATDIWKCVESGLNEEEIVKHLVEKYSEVSEEKVLADTMHVINVLKEENIIV